MLYPGLREIAAPAVEPWTVPQLSNTEYLKSVDFTFQDTIDLFDDLYIQTAREEVEHTLERKLITQTWELELDCQPALIEFPFGELQSVVSVKTIAEDGTETLEPPTSYSISTGDKGRLWLRSGSSWASTTRVFGLMKVQFICGYGDASTDVPATIRNAMVQYLVALYEKRTAPEMAEVKAKIKMCSAKRWTHI